MIGRVIERIGKVGAVFAGVCVVGISVTIGVGALSRYVFNKPLVWMDETVGGFMVITVFTPILYILLVNRHVKIDLVTRKLSPKINTYLLLVGSLLGLGYSVYLFFEGIRLAREMIHYHSMYAMIRIPQVASEVFVPLGFGMLGLGFTWVFVSQVRKLMPESSKNKTSKKV